MKNNTNDAVSAKMEHIKQEIEKLEQERKQAAEKLSLADIAFALNSLVDYWKPEIYYTD